MRKSTNLRSGRIWFSCFLAGSVFVLACLTGATCTPATTPPPETGITDVTMHNLAFSPSQVTIKKGESVRWTNQDFVLHTATSGNPGDSDAGSTFDTGDIANGKSVTIQFNDTGEFTYFCRRHPTIMFGAKVTVTE
jgi:plastocyanin